MTYDEMLAAWETDGGFSPAEPVITCRVCGDDRSPKIKQFEGWICLVHLPRMGERRGGFLS